MSTNDKLYNIEQLDDFIKNPDGFEIGSNLTLAKQLTYTMRENERLREALTQILDDSQFIEAYEDDDTPIFTKNEKRLTNGGSFCGDAGKRAIEALSNKDSDNA